MESTKKETPEERKLRIGSFKRLVSLANSVRELINKLKKLMKFGVTSENRSLFLESASALHSKLTEIHGCGLPGHEACFNELLKNVSKEVHETCNELLSTLTPPIQFLFELFPGPDDEARRALEEKERLLKESIDASRCRQEYGFTSYELEKFPKWLNLLILRVLTTPRPDALEEDVQCQKLTECQRIHQLLCNKSKVSEFVVTLHKYQRMCGFMMNARDCMKRDPDCPTCTIFSIICQMAHGLNRDDETMVCGSPSIRLTHVLLVAGMSELESKYHYLFLDTYLFVFGASFCWEERVKNITIPTLRDAITNPECVFRKELVDSLTDHVRRYRKDQIEMVDDLYKSLFEEWKQWYTSKESDSSFHPYSFLTMPKFP